MGKNILYQKIKLVQLANLPDTGGENLIHLCDLQAFIEIYNTKTHNWSLRVIPLLGGIVLRSTFPFSYLSFFTNYGNQ
jgi:hypothetical protein